MFLWGCCWQLSFISCHSRPVRKGCDAFTSTCAGKSRGTALHRWHRAALWTAPQQPSASNRQDQEVISHSSQTSEHQADWLHAWHWTFIKHIHRLSTPSLQLTDFKVKNKLDVIANLTSLLLNLLNYARKKKLLNSKTRVFVTRTRPCVRHGDAKLLDIDLPLCCHHLSSSCWD